MSNNNVIQPYSPPSRELWSFAPFNTAVWSRKKTDEGKTEDIIQAVTLKDIEAIQTLIPYIQNTFKAKEERERAAGADDLANVYANHVRLLGIVNEMIQVWTTYSKITQQIIAETEPFEPEAAFNKWPEDPIERAASPGAWEHFQQLDETLINGFIGSQSFYHKMQLALNSDIGTNVIITPEDLATYNAEKEAKVAEALQKKSKSSETGE
jgi:hypothetical protein